MGLKNFSKLLHLLKGLALAVIARASRALARADREPDPRWKGTP